MKKKLLLPLAMAAILLSVNVLAFDFNNVSYTAVYNANSMTIDTDTLGGVTYSTVSYEGLYNGGEPGMPSLPIDYIRFVVPYNATNFTVSTRDRGLSNINLDHLVYPCQRPWFTDGPIPPIALPDTSAYYSGSTYPSQIAWVADEGFLAGENHIVTVAVMPFRYSHTTNADVLTKTTRCSVTLNFQLSDSLPMYPIVRNDSLLREEGYQLTRSMVVNPNQVKNFAPVNTFNPGIGDIGIIQGGIGGNEINGGGITPPQPVDSLLPPPGVDTTATGTELQLVDVNYPYLIVTTPELKHAVRRIEALKRQKGYNVKVVTMNELMHDSIAMHGDYVNGHIAYGEGDSAGVLRQYLRHYFQNYGTKYVLLVGSDVPYRTTTHVLDKPCTFQSDLYFSDLNADWEDNRQFDKSGELCVGRILGKTEEQVNNYTDKLFRYELNPGRGDYNYLGNAFYSQSCGFKDNNTPGHPDEIDIIRCTLDSIYPTPCIMMEPNVNNTGIPYPSGEDIVNELNSTPYSFLSFHHHGCPSSLRTCGRDGPYGIIPPMSFLWANNTELAYPFEWEKNDTLPEYGLNNIKNKNYPSICFSVSCITMPYEIPQYYKDKGLTMSFGESFTTGKDYGGPAYVGNTHNGSIARSAKLEAKVIEKIVNGYYKLGEAIRQGKSDFSLYMEGNYVKYLVATQNLLGDPSLELWTDVPQVYEGISVLRNESNVIVNGVNGQPATISICSNNGRLTTNQITSDVTIDAVSPNSVITLYKHGYIPLFTPLRLQKIDISKSQYVIASDVVAGNYIDTIRTQGDVIIKNGVEYEIEASGTVILQDGFSVEKGATFAIYPSCF